MQSNSSRFFSLHILEFHPGFLCMRIMQSIGLWVECCSSPVLQGSVQLYASYESHFWSSPEPFPAWRLLQRRVEILQKRGCFYAHPAMIIPPYPDLPVKYKMNRKYNRKKSPIFYLLWFPFFPLFIHLSFFPLQSWSGWQLVLFDTTLVTSELQGHRREYPWCAAPQVQLTNSVVNTAVKI